MIRRTSCYITTCTDPGHNLAVEEELLLMTEPGECILYLWQNAHTVVIGKNQNARKECKVDLLREEKGHLVRRLSGGGAVYHDLGNLNFTFLVREEDYDVTRQLSVIIQALRKFGLSAEQTGRNDVVIDGRKFSGNAFYKTHGHCYHHGTLLIHVDMERLSRYLNVSLKKMQSKGVDSVKSRVINLTEKNSSITVESMKMALIEAFGEVYGVQPRMLSDADLDALSIAEREKRFSSEEWILGKKFSYSCSMEERYAWGEIQLLFEVEKEQITACTVHSDAMDETFIPRIADALQDAAFNKESMTEALKQLETENPGREQIRDDVIALVGNSL